MGHHPPPLAVQTAPTGELVATASQSPMEWLLIVLPILVVVAVLYFVFVKKK